MQQFLQENKKALTIAAIVVGAIIALEIASEVIDYFFDFID